jgi:HK97 gp10 family phage protein
MAEIDTAALERDIRKTNAKLREMGVKVQKKVLRKAARAGAAPVLKALRANSPKRRGRFKRTLKQEVKTEANGTVIARIGQDRKKAKQAGTVHIHIIDQGTKPHAIVRGRFRNEYDELPKGPYQHPGQFGQVFVERTQRETRAVLTREFAKKAAQEVDAEAQKVAAQ